MEESRRKQSMGEFRKICSSKHWRERGREWMVCWLFLHVLIVIQQDHSWRHDRKEEPLGRHDDCHGSCGGESGSDYRAGGGGGCRWNRSRSRGSVDQDPRMTSGRHVLLLTQKKSHQAILPPFLSPFQVFNSFFSYLTCSALCYFPVLSCFTLLLATANLYWQ